MTRQAVSSSCCLVFITSRGVAKTCERLAHIPPAKKLRQSDLAMVKLNKIVPVLVAPTMANTPLLDNASLYTNVDPPGTAAALLLKLLLLLIAAALLLKLLLLLIAAALLLKLLLLLIAAALLLKLLLLLIEKALGGVKYRRPERTGTMAKPELSQPKRISTTSNKVIFILLPKTPIKYC